MSARARRSFRPSLLRAVMTRTGRGALVAALLACCAAATLPGCPRPRGGASGAPGTCGGEVPAAELWAERTDAELDARVAAARQCARTRGARVLLEFVATWCEDCQHMTRLEQTPVVAQVLRERYERVRVNVGQWDRHQALRERYGIDRIAAYVVLDPATGQRVAQTTLEPVSRGQAITPEQWAGWLRAPQ